MRSRLLNRVGGKRESPPIELTNLADLALILAFAGLLVPHLVLVPSMDLATSTGSELSAVPREHVTIMLRTDGIYWNQEVIPWLELERRIKEVKESSNPPPKIFLMGERTVPLGLNIDVRSLLRGTDFIEIALLKKDS